MKDIKDMNLQELSDYADRNFGMNDNVTNFVSRLRELHAEHDGRMSALMAKCLDAEMALRVLRAEHEAIKEQARWIPVSERLPTEADADVHGHIFVLEYEKDSPHRVYPSIQRWDDIGSSYYYDITHWKRIT